MSDNVAMENPETDFVRPCNLCPHMKRITLENIYECLRDETNEVLVPEAMRKREPYRVFLCRQENNMAKTTIALHMASFFLLGKQL